MAVWLCWIVCACRDLPGPDRFGYTDAGTDAAAPADVATGPTCGDGLCNGLESLPACPTDCATKRSHFGVACTQIGTRLGCESEELCIARAQAAGGPICVADRRTWPQQGTSHPVDAWDERQTAVTDRTTGLTWAKAPLPGQTWGQALLACTSLDVEGANDWRLPTRSELASLLDFDRTAPLSMAPGLTWNDGDACAWTATPLVGAGSAWTVHFLTGKVSTELPSLGCGVRCVRGAPVNPIGLTVAERFVRLPDEQTVLDRATALRWQLDVTPELSWPDAAMNCAGTSVDPSQTAWRLPTVKELLDIVDTRQILPATDPAFGKALPDALWSATRVAPSQERWWVDLSRGGVGDVVGKNRASRCVQ